MNLESDKAEIRTGWYFIAALLIARIAATYLLPITQDEAYYLQWSSALSWGYLDHPPAVALLGWLHNLWPQSEFAARIGAIVVGLLIIPLTLSTCHQAGIKDQKQIFAAIILLSMNFGAMGASILNTPDTALFVTWLAALHEALAALDGKPRRWLSCGIALGLGVLSKYTVVVFLPAVVFMLWRYRRQKMSFRWPLTGALVALIVCSPHLLWNAQHEWTSIRFQLLRGFTGTHGLALKDAHDFPTTTKIAAAGSAEKLLSDFFEPDPRKVTIKPPQSAIVKFLERFFGFFLGEMLLWGALLVPIVAVLLVRIRRDATLIPASSRRSLLIASTASPLVFFGIVAMVAKVEINWAAMYMVGGSILLAPYAAQKLKWLYTAATLNTLLIIGFALVALLMPPNAGRLSRETLSYNELARWARKTNQPLYAINYQMVSMLRFYAPDLRVDQWPALARRSELTRNPTLAPLGSPPADGVGFWLISDHRLAPQIDGFELVEMQELRICPPDSQLLQTTGSLIRTAYYANPCKQKTPPPWYAERYQPAKSTKVFPK